MRLPKVALAGVVGGALAVGSVIIVPPGDPPPVSTCERPSRFDQQRWKANENSNWQGHPRECMLRDLLKTQPLLGRDSATIVALLGPPDRVPYGHKASFAFRLGAGALGVDAAQGWLV